MKDRSLTCAMDLNQQLAINELASFPSLEGLHFVENNITLPYPYAPSESFHTMAAFCCLPSIIIFKGCSNST